MQANARIEALMGLGGSEVFSGIVLRHQGHLLPANVEIRRDGSWVCEVTLLPGMSFTPGSHARRNTSITIIEGRGYLVIGKINYHYYPEAFFYVAAGVEHAITKVTEKTILVKRAWVVRGEPLMVT